MKKYECDCNIVHKDKVDKTKSHMLDEQTFSELSEFLKTLGDNTRMKILFCIDSEEMCVCDIADTLKMTKSAISHQLAILKSIGVVKNRRDGKEVYYSLDDDHVREVFEIGVEHINHKHREGR